MSLSDGGEGGGEEDDEVCAICLEGEVIYFSPLKKKSFYSHPPLNLKFDIIRFMKTMILFFAINVMYQYINSATDYLLCLWGRGEFF